MKWIKLFEGFEQATKIKWLNDNFLYFKIIEDLKGLQMIETKSNIYFYEELDNERVLKFVYCKKNPSRALRETLLCSYKSIENYIKQALGLEGNQLPDFTLYYLFREIYEKAIKDFFSKYINGTFIVRSVDNWDRYKENFRKTTSYNS